jgi:hypothetical protein
MATREEYIKAGFCDIDSISDFVYEGMVIPASAEECQNLYDTASFSVSDMTQQIEMYKNGVGVWQGEDWIARTYSARRITKQRLQLYEKLLKSKYRISTDGGDLNRPIVVQQSPLIGEAQLLKAQGSADCAATGLINAQTKATLAEARLVEAKAKADQDCVSLTRMQREIDFLRGCLGEAIEMVLALDAGDPQDELATARLRGTHIKVAKLDQVKEQVTQQAG